MKKVILAPDSFKGTLSAREVCAIEAEAVRRVLPDAEAVCLPLSDGGEGLVEAVLGIVPGERRRAEVRGPFGEPVEAAYGVLPDGTAVLEMAAAAGLPLAGDRLRPLEANTFGVGQLLRRAAEDGAGRILLGLGGSCTNDCGAGMAAALGYRFLDESGAEVPSLAKNLEKICRMVPPETPLEVELLAACDVDSPLLGERGATYTFGPQKGADAEALALLEAGMASFARVLEDFCGWDAASLPGAGAAGGLGAMLAALGARLTPGAELVLESAGFDGLLRGADLVLTGEGRLDGQSACGKVVGQVARHCREAGVPCAALCGSIGPGAEALYGCGLTAMFSAVRGCGTFEEVRRSAAEDLGALAESVLRLLSSPRGGAGRRCTEERG